MAKGKGEPIEMLEKIAAEHRNGLSPKDRVRWRWGYVDGIEDAIKILKGER